MFITKCSQAISVDGESNSNILETRSVSILRVSKDGDRASLWNVGFWLNIDADRLRTFYTTVKLHYKIIVSVVQNFKKKILSERFLIKKIEHFVTIRNIYI